jgi:CubicO group peptidase (beta-lactamase class C family)
LLLAKPFAVAQSVDEKDIPKILKDAVDSIRTVGIVVGIIDAGGSKVFSYGKAGKTGADVDGNSVFEIGSVSKTFTATLLADMAERGEVSLNDPISKYLPRTVKVPTRGGKEITLLDLATHRSGLPRMPTNFRPADAENPYADYTVEKMYEFLSNYTLTRDIGEKYEYSNFGGGLLGQILALRAGESYEALLTERILRPLGMDSTAVKFTPTMKSRLAEGHSANLTPVKNWDLDSLAGAGGIRSTTNDMLKYVAAYMGLKQSPLSAAIERAQQDLKDTTIPNMDIGLAWHLRKNPDSVIVWHNGGTGGYHSYVGFDRKKGIGVVVLSNSSNSIDDIGVHLLDPRVPLAKYEPKKERKEITINPSLLDAYVGEYKLAQNFILTITKENERLYVQATGQPRVQLHPEAETDFFLAEVDAQVSFVKDGTGKVTQLTLHQGGRDQKAEKIR